MKVRAETNIGRHIKQSVSLNCYLRNFYQDRCDEIIGMIPGMQWDHNGSVHR